MAAGTTSLIATIRARDEVWQRIRYRTSRSGQRRRTWNVVSERMCTFRYGTHPAAFLDDRSSPSAANSVANTVNCRVSSNREGRAPRSPRSGEGLPRQGTTRKAIGLLIRDQASSAGRARRRDIAEERRRQGRKVRNERGVVTCRRDRSMPPLLLLPLSPACLAPVPVKAATAAFA